jgi:hypothetical protein
MSNDRKQFTENENILLFSEVGGVCPKCSRELMYEKKKNKQKQYEIAHIYPLNPTADETKLLKDEKKLNSDPNHLDNLICLCGICHPQFDKPRTVEEYREMVALKKKIILKNKEKANWENHNLEKEVFELIDFLSTNDTVLDDIDSIKYEPKTIENKTDTTITLLTKRKIKSDVDDYYTVIRLKFKAIDSLKPLTTEIISTQIKAYYIKMSQQYTSQNEIFTAIVEWLFIKTNRKSKDAAEIIAAYFVQNCEIF